MLCTFSFRLRIGGKHALDTVEEELLGMGKGGKKLIFTTREAKLFEVEVVRVKPREGGKTEEKTFESETSSKQTVSQEEEMGSKEESSGGDVVGRMAKLGRAIVPKGGERRGEEAEGGVKEISNNGKIGGQPEKKEILEQETDKERSTMVPKIKRKEGPLADEDTIVGDRGRLGEGIGGLPKAGGVVGGIGGGGIGGGGVSEWSLVMSEVRLQNTELRMSLARVGNAMGASI